MSPLWFPDISATMYGGSPGPILRPAMVTWGLLIPPLRSGPAGLPLCSPPDPKRRRRGASSTMPNGRRGRPLRPCHVADCRRSPQHPLACPPSPQHSMPGSTRTQAVAAAPLERSDELEPGALEHPAAGEILVLDLGEDLPAHLRDALFEQRQTVATPAAGRIDVD